MMTRIEYEDTPAFTVASIPLNSESRAEYQSEPTHKGRLATMIDCRTCAYYSNNECMKPKHGFNACVKADLYKSTGILQLWERK